MVSEGNIPEEMKNMMSSLSGANTNQNDKDEKIEEGSDASSIDFETIMKMKQIMDKMKGSGDDPRANLLRSLKPYLKESTRAFKTSSIYHQYALRFHIDANGASYRRQHCVFDDLYVHIFERQQAK